MSKQKWFLAGILFVIGFCGVVGFSNIRSDLQPTYVHGISDYGAYQSVNADNQGAVSVTNTMDSRLLDGQGCLFGSYKFPLAAGASNYIHLSLTTSTVDCVGVFEVNSSSANTTVTLIYTPTIKSTGTQITPQWLDTRKIGVGSLGTGIQAYLDSTVSGGTQFKFNLVSKYAGNYKTQPFYLEKGRVYLFKSDAYDEVGYHTIHLYLYPVVRP